MTKVTPRTQKIQNNSVTGDVKDKRISLFLVYTVERS